MDIPKSSASLQPDNFSVDEMAEVEYIEVAEEDLTIFNAARDCYYFGTSGEADNCSLFSFQPSIDFSSNEEKEDEPKESSKNRVPLKDQRSSWGKRFRTESAKLEYNRRKANIQRERRQNLVERLASLRAAIGPTEKKYKSCKQLLNHVIHTIPLAERRIECKKYQISCLAEENSLLEEKIKQLELENVLGRGSSKTSLEQEECTIESY